MGNLNAKVKTMKQAMDEMAKSMEKIAASTEKTVDSINRLSSKIGGQNVQWKDTLKIIEKLNDRLDAINDKNQTPMGMGTKADYEAYKQLIKDVAKIQEKTQTHLMEQRASWKKVSSDYEDQLIKGRRLQEVISRANMPLLGFVTEMATTKMQDVNARTQRIEALQAKPKRGKGATTKEEKQELKDLITQRDKGGVFQKLDAAFEKSFGKGSSWDKFFGGHGKLAAGGLAMGGVGAGIGLSKKIIDSSPLMQQMLKIINFGFVLLLRPIGDFFGMILRPIVLLLLRKFIIPFYQTVYPWFLKNGKLIGDTLEGLFDTGSIIVKGVETSLKVAAADITSAIKDPKAAAKATEKINPLAKVLEKVLPKVAAQKLTVTNVKQISPTGTSIGKVVTKPASVTDNILAKVSKPLQKIVLKATEAVTFPAKALAKVTTGALKATSVITKGAVDLATAGKGGKVIDKVTKPVSNAIQKVAVSTAGKTAAKFIPVVGQALLAVDIAGSAMKQFMPDQYEGIRQGALGIGSALGDKDGIFTEGVLDFLGFGQQSTAEQIGGALNSLTGGAIGGNNMRGGKNKMALGGIINEPIFGVGQSGRTYSFGERGAEAVTPLGQGSGTTVNVTVNGSIYSDKDMLNFQRTIMRAIESSNTRRAKI